jgi:tetratricopeptide (TPR) repeat protein
MKLIRVLPGLGLGVALLILGPFRTHYRFEYQAAGLLGLVALTAVWLAVAARRGGRIASSPLDVPLFGLVIAFTIASAASLDPRRSLGQVQLLLAHVLLFWILFDLVARQGGEASGLKPQASGNVKPGAGGGQLEAWVAGLLAVTGLILLLAVAEVEYWFLLWRGLGGSVSPWPPFSYRLTSWLGHASVFSGLVAACAPLAAVAWVRVRQPVLRVALGLWWIGAAVGLIFASSRAGWLALGAGLGSTVVLRALARGRVQPDEGTGRKAGQEVEIASREATPSGRWNRAAKWMLAAILMVALVAIGGLVLGTFRDPTHAPILLSRTELWPPAWAAFTSSPLLGTGPATFHRHFLAANPLSQHTFLTQAHSVVFSLFAEEGLVGAAAAGFVILTGLFAAFRSVRASTSRDQLWRLGALGGLAALGVHALTDNVATTLPVSFVLIVLAALALSGPAGLTHTRPLWGPLLVVLVMLAFGALTLPGQLAFQRGLELARGGDPRNAASAFDEAARDDPRFAWYSLQAGFAHGLAAGEDPSQLPFAIDAFETGIQSEPAYSVHPLNLAWLYWQSGDHELALSRISQAQGADPTSPLILLNWGWMLESSGDLDAARRQYVAALDADALQLASGYATPHGSIPDLSHSLFWDTNTFRRQVLRGWSPRVTPSAYADSLEVGYRQLAEDDLQAARQGFFEARRLDPFRPEAFRGIGLTAARAGEVDEARYYLQVASLARGSAFQRTLAFLDLMELEAGAGRNPEAVQAGLRGFDVLEAYNSWGMGSDHVNSYAWGVFYRESLPDDLLPWVLRPDMSADLADRLLHLARLFDSDGNRTNACRVIDRVLRAAAGYGPALATSALYACGS